MTDLGKVLVLAGGLSHERDVSLRSGRRVAEALRDTGVDVDIRDVDETTIGRLREDGPTIVLPMLHGAPGEDGSLRAVLDLIDVPYLGTTPAACRSAFDKPTAASIVRAAGLSAPEHVVLPRSSFTDLGARALLDAVSEHLGLPLVVKPPRGGSSLGVSIVREAAELPAAMVTCFAYGDEAILERHVAGTEVAVCVIERNGEPEALPLVEIDPEGASYDYEARYTAGETTFFVPARLSDAAAAAARRAGVTAHQALGLRHLSRTDIIVDNDDTAWFLEANVAPGMTETSIFPQAVAASGTGMGQMLRDLLLSVTA